MKAFTAIATTILLSALLLGGYVGTYYALVERGQWSTWDELVDSGEIFPPKYRYGGNASKLIYEPMNRIDRRIRNDYWMPVGESFPTAGQYPP